MQGTDANVALSQSEFSYPWRKSERDHVDDHCLEDVFLGEMTEEDFKFEDGIYQIWESEFGDDESIYEC